MSGSGYSKGNFIEQLNADLRRGRDGLPQPAESYLQAARAHMINAVRGLRGANPAAADAMSEALDALDEVCRCIKRARDAASEPSE